MKIQSKAILDITHLPNRPLLDDHLVFNHFFEFLPPCAQLSFLRAIGKSFYPIPFQEDQASWNKRIVCLNKKYDVASQNILNLPPQKALSLIIDSGDHVLLHRLLQQDTILEKIHLKFAYITAANLGRWECCIILVESDRFPTPTNPLPPPNLKCALIPPPFMNHPEIYWPLLGPHSAFHKEQDNKTELTKFLLLAATHNIQDHCTRSFIRKFDTEIERFTPFIKEEMKNPSLFKLQKFAILIEKSIQYNCPALTATLLSLPAFDMLNPDQQQKIHSRQLQQSSHIL